MNNSLTPRMQAIASLLGENNIVADIGCDHGKLSAYIIKNKVAKKVFATDISKDSLEKAKKLTEKEKLENISFFLGDGFSCLKEKPDAAVIAGMGGQVIADIIDHDFAKTKLVLQPMKDSDILFKKLYSLGFKIEKEVIVREGGRFYEVILAIPGSEEPFDFALPPINKLIKNEDALLFLEHKKTVLEKALNESKKATRDEGKIRLNQLTDKIKMIDEVIKNAYCK